MLWWTCCACRSGRRTVLCSVLAFCFSQGSVARWSFALEGACIWIVGLSTAMGVMSYPSITTSAQWYAHKHISSLTVHIFNMTPSYNRHSLSISLSLPPLHLQPSFWLKKWQLPHIVGLCESVSVRLSLSSLSLSFLFLCLVSSLLSDWMAPTDTYYN